MNNWLCSCVHFCWPRRKKGHKLQIIKCTFIHKREAATVGVDSAQSTQRGTQSTKKKYQLDRHSEVAAPLPAVSLFFVLRVEEVVRSEAPLLWRRHWAAVVFTRLLCCVCTWQPRPGWTSRQRRRTPSSARDQVFFLSFPSRLLFTDGSLVASQTTHWDFSSFFQVCFLLSKGVFHLKASCKTALPAGREALRRPGVDAAAFSGQPCEEMNICAV